MTLQAFCQLKRKFGARLMSGPIFSRIWRARFGHPKTLLGSMEEAFNIGVIHATSVVSQFEKSFPTIDRPAAILMASIKM